MNNRLSQIFVWMLFVWAIGGSLAVLYYQYVDGTLIHRPLTLYYDPLDIPTDKPVYKAGDTIKIRTAFCKHYNYRAETTWRLVNKTVITYPTKKAGVSTLGCHGLDTPYYFPIGEVPERAENGIHHLEGISEIHVNPLRTIFVNFRSQQFEII